MSIRESHQSPFSRVRGGTSSLPSASPRRPLLVLPILAAASLAALCIAPLIGMKFLSPLGGWTPQDWEILRTIRIPRVLTAWLAGAGLALSGMAFQAVFRNPLATPFTLGVSSGASLGAALYIRWGAAGALLGLSGLSWAAFAGALASLALVYGLTRLRGGFSSATLLLAGVAVSYFMSSVILFVQYASGFSHSFRIVRWLMGSLDVTGYEPVRNMLLVVAVGGGLLLFLTHELNLLLTGEDLALSRGVNVPAVKRLLFVAVSVMIGGIVAFCGPIGFVGLMVPHICRLIVGADHRVLTPATLLFGGMFLTLCDALARSVIAPAEIPVGILTALLGGPFFIWLLLTRKEEVDL